MPDEPERRARLSVKVIPRARRSEIVGWAGQRLKLKIAAAPEGGRANDALVAFLAEQLGVPRGSVRIASGHAATTKTIEVRGIGPSEVAARVGRPPRSSH